MHWYTDFIFDTIVNGLVYSILFLDSLLLMYRNTIHFGILISYLETLLNLFIGSNTIFRLGFSI